MDVRLCTLRAEAPDWTWKAERAGFGWNYIGVRGEEFVRIYPVAISYEEEIYNEEGICRREFWVVDNLQFTCNYIFWWLKTYGSGK